MSAKWRGTSRSKTSWRSRSKPSSADGALHLGGQRKHRVDERLRRRQHAPLTHRRVALVPGGERESLVSLELAQQVPEVEDADLDVAAGRTRNRVADEHVDDEA